MKHKKTCLFLAVLVICFMMSLLCSAKTQDIDFSFPDFNTYDAHTAVSESNRAAELLLPQNIFDFFVSTVTSSFSGKHKPLFTLIAVIFISSVISVFKDNLLPASGLLDYVTLLITMLQCFSLVEPLILTVTSYLSGIMSFMTSMAGSMTVMLGASGNTAAAATSSASAAFTTSITQIFSVNVILPCVRVIVALSAISTLSQSIDLTGVINFIRSFCTWGLGALFAVFGGVHSAAVKVSAGADTLAVRGIRFTAARLIPVAGNMVSESLKTVLTGVSVIKTAAGGLGIAYIIYSLIPAICSVLCVKLIILAASFCSKLMGQRKHTAFLEGINSALNILMAVCIFSSVSAVIVFAVFMNTATVV